MPVLKLAREQQGFTLVEMIIGIVVLGVAMTMMTVLIYPQATKAVDPVYTVRAAELAHTLLNEITGKAFDENSYNSSSLLRCDEAGAPACATSGLLGPDAGEGGVNLYDDVDDYNGYNQSGSQLHSGASYSSLYVNFLMNVQVGYDANFDGVFDDPDVLANHAAKLIIVTVTMPNGESLDFSAYRGNF